MKKLCIHTQWGVTSHPTAYTQHGAIFNFASLFWPVCRISQCHHGSRFGILERSRVIAGTINGALLGGNIAGIAEAACTSTSPGAATFGLPSVCPAEVDVNLIARGSALTCNHRAPQ
jgi:hypothetical protein